jgi:hypothetical protein
MVVSACHCSSGIFFHTFRLQASSFTLFTIFTSFVSEFEKLEPSSAFQVTISDTVGDFQYITL